MHMHDQLCFETDGPQADDPDAWWSPVQNLELAEGCFHIKGLYFQTSGQLAIFCMTDTRLYLQEV